MNKKNINLAIKTLKLLENNTWDKIDFEKNFKIEKKNKVNTKKKILVNINNYFDFLLKKNLSSIEISSTKDMLFEVLMARFDILNTYRKSVKNINNYFKSRPHEIIFFFPNFIETIIIMATLANIDVNGAKGIIKIKGIFILYFLTSFTWHNDESLSLEKTMTTLDKYLNQIDKFYKII